MTLGELQERVLGHRFNAGKYTAYVKEMLNEGQATMALQANFRTQLSAQTIDSASGTAAYALESDYSRIVDLYDTATAAPLEQVELRDYDDLEASAGTPYSFVVIGSDLTLYPTPDTARSYRLRYYRLPAQMIETTDEPEIPVEYHHLLATYAVVRCYEREDDFESAMYHRQNFDRDFAVAKGEQNVADRLGTKQVPGMWESDSGVRFVVP